MDLWEACRLVYQNPDKPKDERKAEAYALYLANKNEMDRGSRVLWPEVKPLWDLLATSMEMGQQLESVQYRIYVNNPIDEESAVFRPDSFSYWDGKDIAKLLTQYPRPAAEFDVYMGIDFAMGTTRGDYSAIVTIARHKKTGTIYVVDAWGERVHPDVFLRTIVEKVTRYQPNYIAAEAQVAQEFFVHKLKQALAAARYPARTRVKEIST
ncbi:hypothetical protein [Paenibacillus sp. 1011MAR3C5]|uniref:phage terminase large subunit family protein n=1 Tax=Paenibacillus sp. 1011MAR3C5 TaxID=1675787 RepID=UPI0011C343C7|nr:hypothetical protein [Paenibacillus sp. 1011MAR3C5]